MPTSGAKTVPKAIIFDIDNTLIDFISMKRAASAGAAKAMIEAGLQDTTEDLSERLFAFYLEHGIESDDAFEEYLRQEYQTVDYRILAAAVDAYFKEKYLGLKPHPGVVDTLRELKRQGFKLGVVSDGFRLKAWMRLNGAGLDTSFSPLSHMTIQERGNHQKSPSCSSAMSLRKPEECPMVGDWPERDVQGGSLAGMKTCLAKYGQTQQAKADYQIESFSKLRF